MRCLPVLQHPAAAAAMKAAAWLSLAGAALAFEDDGPKIATDDGAIVLHSEDVRIEPANVSFVQLATDVATTGSDVSSLASTLTATNAALTAEIAGLRSSLAARTAPLEGLLPGAPAQECTVAGKLWYQPERHGVSVCHEGRWQPTYVRPPGLSAAYPAESCRAIAASC